MTDRWSNPSGGLGTHRFSVWPGGTDSYDHAANAANWDMSDNIIGIPSSGTWPPTFGIDGGIYREIRLLQLEREDIGSVKAFFKPTDSYPIPTGWAVADGSVIAPSNHDFIGISGSVTLPDYRHAFLLGADPNKSIGTSAAAVNTANIDNASGAPGPQATGGSNQHLLTKPEMPSHDHGGGAHTHSLGRQIIQLVTGGLSYLINVRDQRTHTETTDSSGTILNSEGGDNPHENRPRWVGTIYIVKIKHVSTI